MALEPFEINCPVFEDHRGCFFPVKLFGDWFQSNISISDNIFTFRGLHLQTGRHKQTKRVSVVRGSIIDFCVDLRPETFGNVFQFVLGPGQGVFVPNYFAHGFLTLEENTLFSYKCTQYYSPENERTIYWNDETIEINWGIDLPIVSKKDTLGEKFINLY